ncbi:M23 family metallopeptidase [Bacillus sp. FJAT-26390]|uniref:M23 family metallopeptidase n=1 Tax=Bacillus sp. FJAT-26390 TaxID=1743142 RepID=UPI000807A4E9|nr:M23 family metallopeptidase [Bacillus sp. FJAT-26390]OBZ12441.1 hypothetical protein A7975_15570 [Bacillus sp. FJAT-26390]
MQMKDDMNQRNKQKKNSQQNRQPTAGQMKENDREALVPYKHEYFHQDEREEMELDPEVVWKTNPNPWASWGEDNGFSHKRSYVKGPDLTDKIDPRFGRGKHPFRKELKWKFVIAILVFGAVWAMFRYDTEYTLKGQAVVKQALTDEIDFAAAAAWYKETFAGAPSFIPIFEDKTPDAVGADGTVKLPVVAPLQGGLLVRTFAELLNGIELAGKSEEQVVASETGRVLLMTDQNEKGSTVIIQHANKRVTIYGQLGKTNVQVNDWVEAGDPIGNLRKAEGTQPSLLYFAVKQNELYIDPVGVIPFD